MIIMPFANTPTVYYPPPPQVRLHLNVISRRITSTAIQATIIDATMCCQYRPSNNPQYVASSRLRTQI